MLLTARQNNDLARAEECKDLLDQCHDYLEKCINRKGRLQHISSLERTHARLILRSVQRLYGILQPRSPELTTYLQQHVANGL